MNSFIDSIKKVKGHRVHKVVKSLGVYDAYKYIRKNKWFDIGRPVTEHEFYTIIREVNKLLAEELSNGNDIKFPHRLGGLEVRKYNASIYLTKGKVKTNLPIDWNRTLKLWEEDKISYKNKVLIRQEEKEIYKIFYNRTKANYNNKSFYEFKVNRQIKQRLKENIREGKIEAFLLTDK